MVWTLATSSPAAIPSAPSLIVTWQPELFCVPAVGNCIAAVWVVCSQALS
jgi:hypothetical protein